MKELLFLAADLWLMATTWICGFRALRFRNHLLCLEWFVVAVSSTNFLVWSLLGGDESSPMYHLAYILDAFSRSFGFTLLLVVGLLTVTHGYKPPLPVKLGVVALTAVTAVILGPIHDDRLVHDTLHLSVAWFYVATNLLTTVFLAYFTMKVWKAGAHLVAVLTGLATAAGTYVAVTYDFFPFSFDDEYRTIFYTIALTVWGCQAITLFHAYRALHEHREAAVATSAPIARVAS
ncbi:hypothetical protein QI633_03620 [Nocardioides sp. QY071]|uniref:hypothetical protein n=1 Tax=Nocardioides sp. QY071 TaxID=3044187 RepID=UPI00249AC195|nr:hypothetical protein [Nocardioides sp. QY071]WGY02851.1 hypothetical protein QI633_03620 [Nocardioides sp. QY071]